VNRFVTGIGIDLEKPGETYKLQGMSG